jgi:hypothetical protein
LEKRPNLAVTKSNKQRKIHRDGKDEKGWVSRSA